MKNTRIEVSDEERALIWAYRMATDEQKAIARRVFDTFQLGPRVPGDRQENGGQIRLRIVK